MKPSRRVVLVGGVALALPSFAAGGFEALEKKLGGQLGLFARRGAKTVSWREQERFAYCSVFKWLLAAAVLEARQRGRLALEDRVKWTEQDLIEPSTGTRPHLATGLTIGELCAAAVTVSDNTATDLLEKRLGGLDALRAFARRLGDEVMRFDRLEPELNTNLPGDPRDTTTPRAMATLLERAYTSDVLDADSKRQLFAWMKATTTGLKRIRAAVPPDWDAGDKTGTSENGAANDVAVLRPPTGAPIYLAIFTNAPKTSAADASVVIAEAARLALKTLA
ncbi:MAG: class A beta-lactamase [Myxococcota bacterium]